MANSHPGSYCGQDAYNDMLIVEKDESLLHRERASKPTDNEPESGSVELHGRSAEDSDFLHRGGETSQTLDASYYKGTGSRNGNEREVLAVQENNNSVVRRLTPMECERLQQLPDKWTDIGEWTDSKGKVHKESSDTARYRAIGNGIALPFWAWLLKRISAQYERTPTMGGLFSGIGSFELIWARINGLDSVKFTCEIEDFPNAVMRKHFDDQTQS